MMLTVFAIGYLSSLATVNVMCMASDVDFPSDTRVRHYTCIRLMQDVCQLAEATEESWAGGVGNVVGVVSCGRKCTKSDPISASRCP